MNKDFLEIGANRYCGRCGELDIPRDKIHGLELEGGGSIWQSRQTEIEDTLCHDCRYELEEWMYGKKYEPRKEVDLSFHINTEDQ